MLARVLDRSVVDIGTVWAQSGDLGIPLCVMSGYGIESPPGAMCSANPRPVESGGLVIRVWLARQARSVVSYDARHRCDGGIG